MPCSLRAVRDVDFGDAAAHVAQVEAVARFADAADEGDEATVAGDRRVDLLGREARFGFAVRPRDEHDRADRSERGGDEGERGGCDRRQDERSPACVSSRLGPPGGRADVAAEAFFFGAAACRTPWRSRARRPASPRPSCCSGRWQGRRCACRPETRMGWCSRRCRSSRGGCGSARARCLPSILATKRLGPWSRLLEKAILRPLGETSGSSSLRGPPISSRTWLPSGRIERMLLRSVRPLVMRLLTKTIRLPLGVKVGS